MPLSRRMSWTGVRIFYTATENEKREVRFFSQRSKHGAPTDRANFLAQKDTAGGKKTMKAYLSSVVRRTIRLTRTANTV